MCDWNDDANLKWLQVRLFGMGRISVSETARGDAWKLSGVDEGVAGTIQTRKQEKALMSRNADSHQEEKQRLGHVWG